MDIPEHWTKETMRDRANKQLQGDDHEEKVRKS